MITEKEYPISNIWPYKSLVGSFLMICLFALLSSPFIVAYNTGHLKIRSITDLIPFIVIATVVFSFFPLRILFAKFFIKRFHYSIGEQSIELGGNLFIINTERNIQYASIQKVNIKQDLFDKIFGISTLEIKTSSKIVSSVDNSRQFMQGLFNKNKDFMFDDANIQIQGLRLEDSVKLKEFILQKMIF